MNGLTMTPPPRLARRASTNVDPCAVLEERWVRTQGYKDPAEQSLLLGDLRRAGITH